jgi:predicted RNA binding protein YcfA (HicA-like mRNA interferase family)
LKAYSGRELVRLLEERGWRVERIEGSHHILARPDREEALSIPVHGSRSLKIDMIRAILRTARIRIN